MHNTFSGWLVGWTRSPSLGARRHHAGRACTRCCAWPAMAASALVMARPPLELPCGAAAAANTKPVPVPSPRRCVRALLPGLVLLLALPSRACGLSRLRSCRRLALMALRPRRLRRHLLPRARYIMWAARCGPRGESVFFF